MRFESFVVTVYNRVIKRVFFLAFHPTEKANGIAQSYAWLDKHPDADSASNVNLNTAPVKLRGILTPMGNSVALTKV